ncbi:hypothetical protein [uncultured Pseudodesulfovibrio sp.]|uniref:hypothetical protein n=1 Tax=uncultured Pseudodesulfovibrio sp. TaxID=2035858 RepID=UPI0029C65E42|nr:hypothetical protein [uncultured Pseudodesulfovibrio sp.]
MNSNINEIEQSIMRMTAVVRQEQAQWTAKSFGQETDPKLRPRGWWVLACGEPLDNDSFDNREKSREQLLEFMNQAGIMLPENIWVWDETGIAQLVITTVPTLERAQKLAKKLRTKGLSIRVKRETF